MVVGAGRGPLVKATLKASLETQRQVKVYAVEKNPGALVTWASAHLGVGVWVVGGLIITIVCSWLIQLGLLVFRTWKLTSGGRGWVLSQVTWGRGKHPRRCVAWKRRMRKISVCTVCRFWGCGLFHRQTLLWVSSWDLSVTTSFLRNVLTGLSDF